ncbi:unnamed protein product, partial [marine sediment metagenome]
SMQFYLRRGKKLYLRDKNNNKIMVELSYLLTNICNIGSGYKHGAWVTMQFKEAES